MIIRYPRHPCHPCNRPISSCPPQNNGFIHILGLRAKCTAMQSCGPFLNNLLLFERSVPLANWKVLIYEILSGVPHIMGTIFIHPWDQVKIWKTVWDFFWSWRKEINRSPLYSLPLHVMSSALDCQPFLEHHKKSWWSFSNDEIIPNWWKCRYGNAVFFLQFGGRVSLALPQYSPVLPNFYLAAAAEEI